MVFEFHLKLSIFVTAIVPHSKLLYMKYPIDQFEVFTQTVKQINSYIDIANINPCALHYLVYQQFASGQTHNALYWISGAVKKKHQFSELELTKAVKLVNSDFDFLLYPKGCDDSHIETAGKRVIKELYTNI